MVIYRLFIDENDELNKDELEADELYDAYQFLMDKLTLELNYHHVFFRYENRTSIIETG